MAPSRRKGSSKAAAAAAARRQWKVGDLVLAKVKGFPAWPATVSEPEKWGYSTDWKKVLVYFFGTQQIAFCNPADVEPFTEEKKQSLLVKRHGKGADFVRAVQEIVESYEKLRKQEQDDGCEDVAHKNEGNSADFSSNLGSKSQLEAPEATFDSQINSHSTADGNEPRHHAENTSATAHKDAVDGNEEPSDSAAVTEIPLRTISRKRSKDLPFQNGTSQRKDTMVRRSRSSSRLESRRLRGSTVQCNDSGKGAGDLSPTVARDGLLQRNKQKRQSTDASESDVVDLSAFVSSGSTEDIGSEIVTIESDTLSFNEGSAIDSGCKIEHSETLVGYVDGDVELSKGLDLQIKAVVIKKKRKPNRKRPINDAVEPTGTVDMEAGVQNTSESSRNACEKMNGSCSKEDGDEHLPLVKRARVRMGESSLKEPNKSLSNTDENLQKEVTVHTAKAINKSSRCDDSTGRDSFMIHSVLDASPSRGTQLPENKPQLWKHKKDQSFGCSVDGEAALPPSKRLHRALEAMSANAAEEDQSHNDVSSDLNRLTNVQSISPMRRSPDISMTLESKIACEVVQQNVDLTGSNAQGAEVSGLATSFNTIAVKNDELFQETGALNKKLENPNTQNNKSGEECFLDAHYGDEKNPCGGSSGSELAATAVPTQSLRYLSSSPDRKESDVRSVQGSADELSLSTDKGNAKGVELINNTLDKREHELETCKCTAGSMDTVSDMHDDIVKVSPQCGTGVDRMSQLNTESIVCENTRSSEPPLDDNRDEKDMSEVVTELVNKQREEDHLSSPSFPNDHLGEDLAIHSSPFLTDGGDSLAQASPANASLGHVSTSDNSSFLQNNGSCSPDVHLHDKITSHPSVVDEEGKFESAVTQRSKFLGKYAEAIAALSSFEAMLGTLTRTKESIGRATRVAIDCAKFGVSSKVVDVLARCLETESSLHRRVDLFFLVDSIVKGDVGGWYPAAIQAVLPRLLAAAAPPGNSAHENRRQCLKVLRLWLERKILPESIIRRHMRELDSYGCCPSGAFSRRSMRTERSLDDPLREMEGMLVDEYGSNSSFQLPGFCMPSMLKDEDEGSDSDGGSFEAVTPEHSPDRREDHEKTLAVEKHRHILEDVDGELEMEDVAPSCETELTSSSGAIGAVGAQNSQNQFEPNMKLSFAPPLPQDVPPSSPPLPSSPPPPPPPAMHPPSAVSAPYANGMALKLYAEAHNMQDTMVQSVAQQSNAPRSNHYHPSECRDHQRQMPESFPGPNFHNKGYPLRPPHPPPSNQFSYVREEQHFKPRREGVPPPLYSNRHHFVQNWDRENFYNNHERMKQAPHEHHDGWRFPPHSFSGPQYPGKGKSFGPVPFVGPPSEQTRFPDQGWRFPPRSMSHRDSMPFRPPLEGPIPVSSRGPGFWRPR